jgi:hypothetical protein
LLVSSICLRISSNWAVFEAFEKSMLINPSMLPIQCFPPPFAISWLAAWLIPAALPS